MTYSELIKKYARELVNMNEYSGSYAELPKYVRRLYWLEGQAAEDAGSWWDQDRWDVAVIAEVDRLLVADGITA